jgi:hypothetical protein
MSPSFFRWEGCGVSEVGRDKKTGQIRVKVNPKFYRPTDVVSILLEGLKRRAVRFISALNKSLNLDDKSETRNNFERKILAICPYLTQISMFDF